MLTRFEEARQYQRVFTVCSSAPVLFGTDEVLIEGIRDADPRSCDVDHIQPSGQAGLQQIPPAMPSRRFYRIPPKGIVTAPALLVGVAKVEVACS